jgi:hypothetical protein
MPMKPSDFEERAYEAPLYNQLERGDRRVWTPGQVFEHHVGVDRGLFVDDDWIFQRHGHRAYLPGAALARYSWPRAWFGTRRQRRLPNFRLNLFVQAKRPFYSRRITKKVAGYGLTAPFWCFRIDDEQQKVLGRVAARLAGRALVTYASAAFHTYGDLYRHTQQGSVVVNSTFPSAQALAGHDAWYYSAPGAVGVANPNPTSIAEETLSHRIRDVVASAPSQPSEAGDWPRDLKELADVIQGSLSDEGLPDSARRASFFDMLTQIERDTEPLEEAQPSRAYFTVLAFCEAYSVAWSVLGEGVL